MCVCIYTHVCNRAAYTSIYIYICIHAEREEGRERESKRESPKTYSKSPVKACTENSAPTSKAITFDKLVLI